MEGTKSKFVDQSLSAESYGLLKHLKNKTKNKTQLLQISSSGSNLSIYFPSPWISFGPWRACQCLMFTVKDELTIIMNNNAACDRCFTKWRPRCSLGRNNASSLGTDWVVQAWLIQCCFTSTETVRLIRDGNLRPQKSSGLLGTETRERPTRLSHSS